MIQVNVSGRLPHEVSGWRRVFPPGKPWECVCGSNPGYLVACTDCGAVRPDKRR